MRQNIFIIALSLLMVSACSDEKTATAPAAPEAPTKTVTMHAISAAGIGDEIGTLTLTETPNGTRIKPDLAGLPPGEHGFHLHANATCGSAEKDGTMTAGQAAGGHFDPDATGVHAGPGGKGHKGDLPRLTVAQDGSATTAVEAPGLHLSDFAQHALMIHAGGDNYADTPQPLGGGGVRIACGVVE